LADGENLSLAGLSADFAVTDFSPFPEGSYSVPEISYTIWVPVGPIPIPVRVALGMSFELVLDAELKLGLNMLDGSVEVLQGTYFEPSVSAEPYVFGGLGIDGLNIGLEAGGELGLHYRGEYNSVDGYEDCSWGTFQINLRAVATAGEKYVLASWTMPEEGPWTFGDVPPGLLTPAAIRSRTEPLIVLPWPNVAADDSGNVLFTRVTDLGAGSGEIDPEIFFALRDSGGSWSTLSPIATNNLIESDPDAAFDGLGGAVVSWVANTIDPALVGATDYEVYLETQEIYSSYWNGTSWGPPQAVTADSTMDGAPEVAFREGKGLMVWEHAGGTNAMDLDGFDIFHAVWDSVTHEWGAPMALTNDEEGDWSPALAFGPTGEAMSVWVHDADPYDDPTTAELHYAIWNGAAWSDAAAVPLGSTAGVREPRIAYTSAGDVLLTWVGNEGGADILYTSTWDHVTNSWSTPDIVPGTSGVIEGLDLGISPTDQAMLVWHGWDGQNDLFATTRNLTGSDPWGAPTRITNNIEGEWMASTCFDSADVPVIVWANEDATNIFFGPGTEGIELEMVPNLQVSGVEVTGTSYIEGDGVRLIADVANVGWAEAAATTIQFYIGDPDDGGTPIGNAVDVSALAPGTSATLVSDVFALPAGRNDYYAVVTSVPGETVIDDNSDYTTLVSESPDTIPPDVTLTLPPDGNLPWCESVLTLSFSEQVAGLTESDLSLVEEVLGVIVPSHLFLAANGTWAQLIFEGGLPSGRYVLQVMDSVVDLAGNRLDGNGDGLAGGTYEVLFDVDEPTIITIGAGGNSTTVSIRDIDSDIITIGLSGPGSADVTLDRNTNIVSIELSGTTGMSGLLIGDDFGGPGTVSLGNVTTGPGENLGTFMVMATNSTISDTHMTIDGNMNMAMIMANGNDFDLTVGGDLPIMMAFGNFGDGSQFDISGDATIAIVTGRMSNSNLSIHGNALIAMATGGLHDGSALTVDGDTTIAMIVNGMENSTFTMSSEAILATVIGGMDASTLDIGGPANMVMVTGGMSNGSSVNVGGNLGIGMFMGAMDSSNVTVTGDANMLMLIRGDISNDSRVTVGGDAGMVFLMGDVLGSIVDVNGEARMLFGLGDVGVGSRIKAGNVRMGMILGNVAGTIKVTNNFTGNLMLFKGIGAGGALQMKGNLEGKVSSFKDLLCDVDITGDMSGDLLATLFGNVTIQGSFSGRIGNTSTRPGTGNTLTVNGGTAGGLATPADAFANYLGYPG